MESSRNIQRMISWVLKKQTTIGTNAFLFSFVFKCQKAIGRKNKVIGGKWVLETKDKEPYNQGILILLPTAIKVQKHFLVYERFVEIFFKTELWWYIAIKTQIFAKGTTKHFFLIWENACGNQLSCRMNTGFVC